VFSRRGVSSRELLFTHLAANPWSKSLEEAIQKADVLLEALQWIRQFRGKVTVIKLGGGVM
jgi:hypothetical protein